MKLKAHQVEGFIKSPDPNILLVLIYGSDLGMIREHARTLANHALSGGTQDADPMAGAIERVDLDAATLARDPGLLRNEAASVSMFADPNSQNRRVVMLRTNGDQNAQIVKDYLADPVAEALVIIEASKLTPASKLRKAVESDKNSMALPCFEDDPGTIQRLARAWLEAEGFRIEAAAMDRLSQRLGADRGVTRQELERLALFVGPRGSKKRAGRDVVMITLDDVEQMIGDGAAASVENMIDAVAGGMLNDADQALTRLSLAGTPAPAVLNRLRTHFQNLHLAQGHIENGMSRNEAMRAAFRPSLHFKRVSTVERQISLWPKAKISTALNIIHETETSCRETGSPDVTLAAYAMLRLARAAKR